jgi:hypothetical protein
MIRRYTRLTFKRLPWRLSRRDCSNGRPIQRFWETITLSDAEFAEVGNVCREVISLVRTKSAAIVFRSTDLDQPAELAASAVWSKQNARPQEYGDVHCE